MLVLDQLTSFNNTLDGVKYRDLLTRSNHYLYDSLFIFPTFNTTYKKSPNSFQKKKRTEKRKLVMGSRTLLVSFYLFNPSYFFAIILAYYIIFITTFFL